MKNIKISLKLIIYFLSIGITLIAVVGFFSYNKAKNALELRTEEQLISIRDIKKNQVENFFAERIGDVKVLADNPTIQQAAEEFHLAYTAADKSGIRGNRILKDSAYEMALDNYGRTFSYYMNTYGYYDVFVIDDDANVVYTVAQEADLFTNLARERTHLSEIFDKCMKTGKPALSDMEKYAPSDDAPAMFVATPILYKGDVIGAIALQISNEAINSIMQQQAGLGESGETYLVGDDYLLRSDSRFSTEETVLKQKVETEGTRDALAGQTDAKIIEDYRGINVLSAYSELEVGDHHWAILAEIDEDEALAAVSDLASFIIILAIIAIILLVIIAFLIARSFSLPISKAVVFAQEIANGNLLATIDVDQKDEIGQLAEALNTMVEKLKNIMANVQSGADQIASASEESSSSSQEMSEGANEQASSIEEVSATMEEMTANMQQSSSNSQQTEQIALKAAKDIKIGSEAVTNTVESMKIIADKISIITEIANQTNMLALNAAVEAARAGKKGKGFAVVATEVKNLAERSAKAAEEIDKVSAESVLVAENAGNMLTAIVPDIEKTSILVAEITSAIAEQSASSEQISNSIDEMNKVTQQNSAVSEELASSAEELAAQSDLLKETIAFFDIGNTLSSNSTHRKRKPLRSITTNTGNGNGNNVESNDKGVKLNLAANEVKDEEFERY